MYPQKQNTNVQCQKDDFFFSWHCCYECTFSAILIVLRGCFWNFNKKPNIWNWIYAISFFFLLGNWQTKVPSTILVNKQMNKECLTILLSFLRKKKYQSRCSPTILVNLCGLRIRKKCLENVFFSKCIIVVIYLFKFSCSQRLFFYKYLNKKCSYF